MGLFDIFRSRRRESASSEPIEILASTTSRNREMPEEVTDPLPEISLEERLERAVASKQGLFPHEILVLAYAYMFQTSHNEFQPFWRVRYGITDVQAILDKLVREDFLGVDDLAGAVIRCPEEELRHLLKERGLDDEGAKAELASRTLGSLDEEELERAFPARPFTLTLKGEKELVEGEYIPYIHRRSWQGLDIWSLNILVHTPPRERFREKVWKYLVQRSGEQLSEGDYISYRGCRLDMAQLLREEKKPKEAVVLFAEAVFYELNLLTNSYKPELLTIFAPKLFPYENSQAILSSSVVELIAACQEDLGCSDEYLKSILVDRMSSLRTDLEVFTPEECAQIVFFERDCNTRALTQIYRRAEERFMIKNPGILREDEAKIVTEPLEARE